MIDPEKMRLFMQALKPDLPGLARQVFIENPQTAMRELPGKLQASRDLLNQYEPGKGIDPRLMDQFMNLTGSFAPMGVTAFHGSPYLFRQFDPMKRGTGEGAQNYGAGAGYTAEARPVAESYKSSGQIGFLEREADKLMFNKSIDEAIAGAKKELKFVKENKAPEATVNEMQSLVNLLEARKSSSKEFGYLYKGDIPDEIIPKFLDWDKPIKDQSAEVQKLAKQYKLDPDDLGGDLVGRVGKTVEGSKIMEDAGIRGIKYLDANSRNAKYGSQNLIPFRPEDYKVQEINDIPIDEWIRKGLL